MLVKIMYNLAVSVGEVSRKGSDCGSQELIIEKKHGGKPYNFIFLFVRGILECYLAFN